MKLLNFRIFTLAVVLSSLFLPLLAGCGNRNTTENPNGLSARQIREQKQGTTGQ